ncbi:unnamed protein product [Adineta ricciae]|uniref:Uncharacterized protein n=1 Tax=Adineta ricciae TaxID=249248 RepID=A0A815WSH1_ADIRI|nr:unnamed protein product [Adineta ricciae]
MVSVMLLLLAVLVFFGEEGVQSAAISKREIDRSLRRLFINRDTDIVDDNNNVIGVVGGVLDDKNDEGIEKCAEAGTSCGRRHNGQFVSLADCCNTCIRVNNKYRCS